MYLDVLGFSNLNPKSAWKAVKHLRIKPFPPLVLCLDVAGRLACPYDP